MWALIKKLFNFLQSVGRFITRGINLFLVAMVYFLAIGPVSLIFRATGRDLLESPKRTNEASFWLERPPVKLSLEDFGRQF